VYSVHIRNQTFTLIKLLYLDCFLKLIIYKYIVFVTYVNCMKYVIVVT
jgi:hypothetical protein